MKVAVNDAEIFFDVEGTGLKVTPKGMIEKPVCVILHGGPGGDHSAYRPWLSELADYMQLIYVDHRGTGRSGKVPFESLKIEQFADDLDALRETLGIEKWNVLGCSFGGMWALTYAVRHQEKIDKLILLDTAASWKECWEDVHKAVEKMGNASQKRVYREVFDGKIGTADASKKWYGIMLPLYLYNYNPKIARDFQARGKGSPEVSQYMWKNVMFDYDLRAELPKIKVPTMVMVGKHDWVTPISQSRYIAKHIPRSKLVVFQNSGHMVYIDENKKFLNTMKSFLKLR
jgi:proline iminopeptidase